MWQSIISSELDLLRVDQDHSQLFGRILIKQADQNRVDTDRLAHSCSAGNEQVRHFLDITDPHRTGNIFSKCKCQCGLGLLEIRTFDDRPQTDGLRGVVRHFDPYCVFPGDRGLDADRGRRQIHGDIV